MDERTDTEQRLEKLDEACDPALSALLALWQSLACDGLPPPRQAFDPFTLKRWLGHISIYEKTEDHDFVIRLEGSAIVAMTGENWTAYRASDIDTKYGSQLLDHIADVARTNKPAFHRMLLFQRKYFYVSRILLPLRKREDGPSEQVFLAMYKDVIQPDD